MPVPSRDWFGTTEILIEPSELITRGAITGAAPGVEKFETAEANPVPCKFVAVTEHVYAVPFASPFTVIGLVVPVAVPEPQATV